MRRVLLVVLAAVFALALVSPTLAASPDNVKLRVFVHYPKHGKPESRPGVCEPTDSSSSLYGLTGWKLPAGTVVYHVNYGSIPSSVGNAQTAIRSSFAAWELNGVSFSFNEGSQTTIRGAKRDGLNVVVWGNVPSGAIAVTYTWYNSVTGQAVESDTVMGKSLPWAYTEVGNPDGTCGNLYAYDVRDILTHEVGHWVGLDDLYSQPEHDLTMYGYGDKGELKKDTLGTGDVDGVAALYRGR